MSAALGALLIQAAQATLGGEPAVLAVLNAIGSVFGLDMRLNGFDRDVTSTHAISFKEVPIATVDAGSPTAAAHLGITVSKALISVLVPATVTAFEPFWFNGNGGSTVDFEFGRLSDSGSGSGSGSLSLGTPGCGSSGGNDECSEGDTDGYREDSASGAGHHHHGDNGHDNGDGNGEDTPPPPPSQPPTGSLPGLPDATSDSSRPIAGGAPPPPPPPEPGMGTWWEDNGERHVARFFHLAFVILASMLLHVVTRFLKHKVSKLRAMEWYRKMIGGQGISSTAEGVQDRGRPRSCMRRTPVLGTSLAYVAHNEVRWVAEEKVEQLFVPTPTRDLLLDEEDLVDGSPIAHPSRTATVTSARGTSALDGLYAALVGLLSRILDTCYGLVTMSGPAKVFWITLIGLFVYYRMLIQAARIMHYGHGRRGYPERSAVRLNVRELSVQVQGDEFVVNQLPAPEEVSATCYDVEVTQNLVDNISIKEDVVLEDEEQGIYSSIVRHCPLRLEEPGPSTSASAAPSSSASASTSSTVPAMQVEHIGGIPVTECDIRPGGRERREKRCRKKKASTTPHSSLPRTQTATPPSLTVVVEGEQPEVHVPKIESKSALLADVNAQEEDSRGLKSSMWAS